MIASFPLLSFLIFFPLVGIVGLLFARDDATVRVTSLWITCINFLVSLVLWISFDKFSAKFQFFETFQWLPLYNIHVSLGVDGISLFFVILTTFLIPVCLLTSVEAVRVNVKEYFLCFLLLESLLLVTFTVLDLLVFYVFFESILIPMFLLIGHWGARERKVKASFYFFIYTVFGSLLMLMAIAHIYVHTGTTDYQLLANTQFPRFLQKVYWLAFFASFAIKVPMFPFHIWLPEAHVEAPTAGSVLLAGILLKLGSYGFLRFSFPLFPVATVYFTPLVFTLAVLAVVYASLTALRQTDMKRIVAYASVAHMNFLLLGMFSLTLQGVEGALLQMLSHGLVSSALFLAIGVLYDRYHTRLVTYYSGVAHTMPFFVTFFLVYIMANIALPGTSSFVGELLVLVGLFQHSTTVTILGATGMFLGGSYSLWFFNRVCYGNLKDAYLYTFQDLTVREWWIHLPLAVGILVMGICPNLFLSCMHMSVQHLLLHMLYYL